MPLNRKDNQNLKQFNSQENSFKDYNIHLDLYNFEDEIKKYKLEEKREFFIIGMDKAINTLKSLIKVKQVKNHFFRDEDLIKYGINKWDKSKIGNETRMGMADMGIDLYIFIRFGNNEEMGKNVLASASPLYFEKPSGQPLLGRVTINRDVDYKAENSLNFFQVTILHEFTHILGFFSYVFQNYLHNYYLEYDSDNNLRAYINSTKVVNVAKKYFNCSTIKGVALENYGGNGTFGSHWEERILLGDYMNGVSYEEEEVISEFTLALLEDTGFYKIDNYYTGGLMQYGKNKGCDFIYSKCVIDYKVNPKFQNEFFDFYSIKYDDDIMDPGCTSGR